MTTTTAAITRYVTKCGRCHTAHAVDTLDPLRFWDQVHGYDGGPIRCRECGRSLVRWDAVQGHYSEARACDVRCTSATGFRCECQCGGHNHGADNR